MPPVDLHLRCPFSRKESLFNYLQSPAHSPRPSSLLQIRSARHVAFDKTGPFSSSQHVARAAQSTDLRDHLYCDIDPPPLILRDRSAAMPSATSPKPDDTHPTTSTHPDIPPFPPPQTFAFLPDIFELLSRISLLLHQQSAAQKLTATSPASPPQTSPLNPLNLSPLELKDVPAAIYPLKQKIQKAREAVVAGMVDTSRSIGEQEAEIEALERRCKALSGRLGELGGRAAGEGT